MDHECDEHDGGSDGREAYMVLLLQSEHDLSFISRATGLLHGFNDQFSYVDVGGDEVSDNDSDAAEARRKLKKIKTKQAWQAEAVAGIEVEQKQCEQCAAYEQQFAQLKALQELLRANDEELKESKEALSTVRSLAVDQAQKIKSLQAALNNSQQQQQAAQSISEPAKIACQVKEHETLQGRLQALQQQFRGLVADHSHFKSQHSECADIHEQMEQLQSQHERVKSELVAAQGRLAMLKEHCKCQPAHDGKEAKEEMNEDVVMQKQPQLDRKGAASSSPNQQHNPKESDAKDEKSQGGSMQDELVSALVEMGFPAPLSAKALRLSGGQVERALAMLCAGAVPDDDDGEQEAGEQERKQAGQAPKSPENEELLRLSEQLERQEREEREAKQRADEELVRRMLEQELNEEAISRINDEKIAERLAREEQEMKDQQAARAIQDGIAVQQLLDREEKSGKRLTLEQHNMRVLGEAHRVDQPYNCVVCMDDYGIEQVMVLECRHFACVDCMAQHINTQIDEGKASDLKCMEQKCEHKLSVPEISYCIKGKHLEKYHDRMFHVHLSNDPNCLYCPKASCSTPMIRENDNPLLQCPKCNYRFCFKCKTSDWHSGASCEQYAQWKRENSQADQRFETWAKQNTKPCPKCNTLIEKNMGCDHMTCRRPGCGYEFYWSTLKKYP